MARRIDFLYEKRDLFLKKWGEEVCTLQKDCPHEKMDFRNSSDNLGYTKFCLVCEAEFGEIE